MVADDIKRSINLVLYWPRKAELTTRSTVEPEFATTTAGAEDEKRLPILEPKSEPLLSDPVKVLEAVEVVMIMKLKVAPEPVPEDSGEVKETLD